jgi:titin
MRQVFMEDSAVFAVIAENRGGTAKCSANLVVEERRRQGATGMVSPSFIQTISDITAAAGQLVRFDARISGTKPLDVYWLKNGKKVTANIKYKILEEDSTYTLLIIEAYPDDSGKYECVAVNTGGEARCDATCVVESPKSPKKEKPSTPGAEKAPELVEPLKDQTVSEGQATVFKTRVVGKPQPIAQWFKGDKVIKPSKYFQMATDRENYTLRISEAFPEDEGTYKCTLNNPVGSVSTSANLLVRAPEIQDTPPKITPLKDVVVEEGSPAQFKTTISGKTKVTVQWFREGLLIPESPDFQVSNFYKL